MPLALHEYTTRDFPLPELSSSTLQVWVRKPSVSHRNWWLCFCSTDQSEVLAWNDTIADVCRPFGAFQQGSHPLSHRENTQCIKHPYTCVNVAQCWEMFGHGCSQAALVSSTVTEVIERGEDVQLTELLLAAAEIAKQANSLRRR